MLGGGHLGGSGEILMLAALLFIAKKNSDEALKKGVDGYYSCVWSSRH